ncbi:hypothetical protein J437_LFUL009304 [Ladona fulva]|uniref:Pre-C2HC domain-containing protein n=1 Tax=Ladona fulva TaxID=123851 RepID=A0A8K0K6U4_LADFU|nr:hypothetical protein J437_LFUL009304 [Ladona fulva]
MLSDSEWRTITNEINAVSGSHINSGEQPISSNVNSASGGTNADLTSKANEISSQKRAPEDDGFTVVQHNRKRPHPTPPSPSPPPIRTKNRFDPIKNSYLPDSTPCTTTPTTSLPNPSAPNKIKIPSIKIKRTSTWPQLLALLKRKLTFPPTSQMAGASLILLQCHTVDDFLKCKEALSSENIEYYTYQFPSMWSQHYVIRDLPASTEIAAIKEDLVEQGFTIQDVQQIYITKPLQSQPAPPQSDLPPPKRPCPLFKISFPHSTQKEDILNIKNILGLKIRISDYITPKLPIQCTKCQQLGHTRNYCNFNPNCIKCSGPHLTSECRKETTDKPQCYLKEPHTANYCEAAQSTSEQKKPSGTEINPKLQPFHLNTPFPLSLNKITLPLPLNQQSGQDNRQLNNHLQKKMTCIHGSLQY